MKLTSRSTRSKFSLTRHRNSSSLRMRSSTLSTSCSGNAADGDGSEVVRELGHDPADAAPGVGHVALVSGDHMDVKVLHCLASCGTGVEPDVVAIRRVTTVEERLDLVDENPHVGPFVSTQVPPRRDQASGNDERVPWANRVPVVERKRRPVRRDPRGGRSVKEVRPAYHRPTLPHSADGSDGGLKIRAARDLSTCRSARLCVLDGQALNLQSAAGQTSVQPEGSADSASEAMSVIVESTRTLDRPSNVWRDYVLWY